MKVGREERAMNYKMACPSCETRVSRWHMFTSPAIYHRCRGCGALFRITTAGWLATMTVVALQILWFVLTEMGVISRSAAIIFLLVTFAISVWLLPYFSPVHLKHQAGKIGDGGTT